MLGTRILHHFPPAQVRASTHTCYAYAAQQALAQNNTEANDASTMIGLVAAGCCISILPGSFYTIHFDSICYCPIADAEATTSLLLAQLKDEVSPLVDAFVKLAGRLA